jgi:GalNAc-alpha-(1->4)-GalNAc-alpha-(1->3)-diNAcBac-PP-undecaprenol alpha-1,4-N-acetyl-D-galactosaminyltransferase
LKAIHLERKSICCVIPSLQAGGMERVMSELLFYFEEKNDYEVHLILYGIKRDVFYPVPLKVIIHKPEFQFDNHWRFISTLRTLYYLRCVLKGIKPATILSFGEYWNNFVLLSIIGLNLRVFVSDRSQPDKSLGKVHDLLRKILYPKASGVIAQTQKAKDIFGRLYRHSNVRVIGNPIPTMHPKRVERENIVLMVGRFIKTKNQDLLIKIFAEINKPNWKLIFVGYDHLKQQHQARLEDLARDLEIRGKVFFEGKQENVIDYYSRSKVFAFTSSSEGFPNVIGEAMAAGLPVVAFDCVAGPAEMIVDGENGFLVPLFNTELFRARLESLMTDDALRSKLGFHAQEMIKRFSVDQIGEQYYQMITQ